MHVRACVRAYVYGILLPRIQTGQCGKCEVNVCVQLIWDFSHLVPCTCSGGIGSS